MCNICPLFFKKNDSTFPKSCSSLRHCIAVLEVPLQIWVRSRAATASRDRETHEAAHNWPRVIWIRRGVWPTSMALPHRPLATPCGRPGACTLTRLPVVRCFLQHIGASGFWVKWEVCQEAVRLGRVVFRRTHGSQPLPLPSPYGSCSNGTIL